MTSFPFKIILLITLLCSVVFIASCVDPYYFPDGVSGDPGADDDADCADGDEGCTSGEQLGQADSIDEGADESQGNTPALPPGRSACTSVADCKDNDVCTEDMCVIPEGEQSGWCTNDPYFFLWQIERFGQVTFEIESKLEEFSVDRLSDAGHNWKVVEPRVNKEVNQACQDHLEKVKEENLKLMSETLNACEEGTYECKATTKAVVDEIKVLPPIFGDEPDASQFPTDYPGRYQGHYTCETKISCSKK